MTFLRENPGYYEKHYERLRQEALSPCRCLERGHGLALFLSRGMVAWMKALATLQPPPPSSEKAVSDPLSEGSSQEELCHHLPPSKRNAMCS